MLALLLTEADACKAHAPKRADAQDARENNNNNIGLLNVSSEKMGDGLDTESIATYTIATICLIMLIKWLKNITQDASNVSRDF